jgi:glycosyltransferase involved in cell wall biosynthesis
MTPAVSFVVPCYKLAHLLPECIDSILCQTYSNFEVLIMDDCSPDNTPEVAQSFQDRRIRYIRNQSNLGHLRNYNWGISLTRGKYVWLISADDYLRRSYILERYVTLMDRNPQVGYVFCPAVSVRNGTEICILSYSVHGNRDRIVNGRAFLKKLLRQNTRLGIVAASGMVRRECYEKISFFPLNMPWAADGHLWCVFALHFDVGYFAEPMACYREHELSMTNSVMQGDLQICAAEDLGMPWVIRQAADEVGCRDISRACLQAAVNEYVLSIASRRYRTSKSRMTLGRFEQLLCRSTASETERNWVRARVYAGIASQCYWQGELPSAKRFYFAGLRKDPWMPKVLAKWFLLSLGNPGGYVLRSVRSLKEIYAGFKRGHRA